MNRSELTSLYFIRKPHQYITRIILSRHTIMAYYPMFLTFITYVLCQKNKPPLVLTFESDQKHTKTWKLLVITYQMHHVSTKFMYVKLSKCWKKKRIWDTFEISQIVWHLYSFVNLGTFFSCYTPVNSSGIFTPL